MEIAESTTTFVVTDMNDRFNRLEVSGQLREGVSPETAAASVVRIAVLRMVGWTPRTGLEKMPREGMSGLIFVDVKVESKTFPFVVLIVSRVKEMPDLEVVPVTMSNYRLAMKLLANGPQHAGAALVMLGLRPSAVKEMVTH